MKALIVDDAPQARKLLRLMLSEVSSETEVVAEAEDADEAVHLIKKHQPDLLFLDIEMPGKSGLQLLELLQPEKLNMETIFITAYNQYAIQAFKLSAIDYLLKPFRKVELQEAVERAQKSLHLKKSEQHLTTLLNNLKKDQTQLLSIPLNYGYEYLPLEKIEYLEADGAYTSFHHLDGRPIVVSKNLKHFETILCGLDTFVKVNRSNIIHLRFVKSFRKEERGLIILHNGKSIKLSPNCSDAFFEKMSRLLP